MKKTFLSICGRIIKALNSVSLSWFDFDLVSGFRVERGNSIIELGTEYGGWAIPDSVLNSSSICYCVGCGEDISFDIALIRKYDCKVFGFDPTPRAIEYVEGLVEREPLYFFRKFGLFGYSGTVDFYFPSNPDHVSLSIPNIQMSETHTELEVRRLSDVMSIEGHSFIDLLKLDIEGAEYDVIDSLVEDMIAPRIVCVEYDELHTPIDLGFMLRVRRSICSLLKLGYQLVNVQSSGNYTFVAPSTLQ